MSKLSNVAKDAVSKIRHAKTLAEKYDIQREAMNDLPDKDSDDLYEYLVDSGEYVSVRTVHMGLNTTKGDPTWESLKEQIKAIVEADGICNASWSCTGRTRHQMQASVLEKDMPEYSFDIGYNYKCEIRKAM